MDSLATGALLAILVHYKSPAEVLRRFRWIGLISGLLFVAYNAIRAIHVSGIPLAPIRIFGNSILALAFASLICLALGGRRTTTLMAWRPLRFFGVYSYGIYVYHGVLLDYVTGWFTVRRLSFHTGHIWIGVLPHYIMSIGAVTLVAVVSYHLLERPFLKLKRFF